MLVRCSCTTETCGLNPSRVSARLCANTRKLRVMSLRGEPSIGEGEPVALVFGPAQRARAAHGEAPGQHRRGAQLHPAAGVAPALGLGPLVRPAD